MGSVFRVLLRRYRRAAGLTQEALAERALLSPQAISALERGVRTHPRHKTVMLLADALKLTEQRRDALISAARPRDEQSEPVPDWAPDGAALRQLPSAVADFTGREEQLTRLVEDLTTPADFAPDVTIRACVVTGMGGIGKTALAVRVGHLVSEHFPDGQLYLNLRGFGPGDPTPVIEALGQLLRSLGVPTDQIPTDVEEAAARYRSALAGRGVLVVLDNAAGADQVIPLLPGTPGCAVLITSRRELADLPGAHRLQLEVLPKVKALALLGKIAGQERVASEPDAAHAVVRRCGHLPLAIRLAGARLATRPAWPIGHLASRLADQHRLLDELADGDTGVRASFAVSIRQLADTPTADAFFLLGLPDCRDISTAAAARLLDRQEDQTEHTLESLVDLHLMDEPAPGRYSMHDLLRLFARERVGTQVGAMRRLFDWYLATALRADQLVYPAMPQSHSTPEPADGLVPGTAATALDWYRSEQENLLALVRQLGRPPYPLGTRVLDLIDALYPFFEFTRRRIDLLQLGELAMAAATDSGDRRALAQAGIRLGSAFLRTGRFAEGIPVTEQSLAIYRELGDAEGQARAVNNLGILCLRHGDADRAAGCFEQSLAICLRQQDRLAQAMVLGNLGLAHVARGAAEPAISCNRQALAIRRELGDRRGEGIILLNLGEALALAGRITEAVDHLDRSLPLLRAFSHQLGEAEALDRLGLVHRDLGDDQLARAYWREAASLYDRLGAPEAEQVRALLAASPRPWRVGGRGR